MTEEVFVHKVTKMIEHRKEDAHEVLKGWFTQDQMKTELKWSTNLCLMWVLYMVICGKKFMLLGLQVCSATHTPMNKLSIPFED